MILTGNCLDWLPALRSETFDCCITSPPYWGLRDYGTADWEGGSADCDHRKPRDSENAAKGSTLSGGKKTTGHLQESWGNICRKCGAVRIDKQLGLEKTPDQYIGRMVEVFSEVRRVLKPSATLWVNIGDSYASGGRTEYGPDPKLSARGGNHRNRSTVGGGLKPKDLVGIPWMLAFALRADGWYLRQDNVWAKKNCMPESVRDRTTRSHEYVFHLSKSQRYYYDADAIAEESVCSRIRGPALHGDPASTNGHSGLSRRPANDFRNKRSVWTIASEPTPDAHFATFPTKLVEPCMLAGCPPGGLVLDPFAGAGTVGLVAAKHGRRFVGIELNPEYVEIARDRAERHMGLFAEGVCS